MQRSSGDWSISKTTRNERVMRGSMYSEVYIKIQPLTVERKEFSQGKVGQIKGSLNGNRQHKLQRCDTDNVSHKQRETAQNMKRKGQSTGKKEEQDFVQNRTV